MSKCIMMVCLMALYTYIYSLRYNAIIQALNVFNLSYRVQSKTSDPTLDNFLLIFLEYKPLFPSQKVLHELLVNLLDIDTFYNKNKKIKFMFFHIILTLQSTYKGHCLDQKLIYMLHSHTVYVTSQVGKTICFHSPTN